MPPSDSSALREESATAPGSILKAFATPIARIAYPHAAAFNEELADLVLARMYLVDNKFSYKAETSADMMQWDEPLIDSLSGWVIHMAQRFIEAVTGRSLQESYLEGVDRDNNTMNITSSGTREAVSVTATRGWASTYSNDSYHPAHFHPNTAIAAIYYVKAPDTCELDLHDPRPNLDYFDPGIQFADEGRSLRLKCKPGELLLFPGWLKHSVPEFNGESVRISMSWNLS